VARELVKENLNRGASIVVSLLQNEKLADRMFIYFNKLLAEEEYFTKNINQYLETENLAFLRKLITEHKEQYNTTIDTITELNLDIGNEEERKDVLDGLRDLGSLTPLIFERYKEIEVEDERKEFAERMKKLQSRFFENINVNKLIEEGEEYILAEFIYQAYKPQNMSFNSVKKLLEEVKDKNDDIREYIYEENGIYNFKLKDVEYALRENEERNEDLNNKILTIIAIADGEEINPETERMREFSQVLKKVAKSTTDFKSRELAVLLSNLGRFPVSHNDLIEKPFQAYTHIKEHLGIYAKDNLEESIKAILEKDKKTKEGFEKIMNNQKRRETLLRKLQNDDTLEEMSNTKLISLFIQKIFKDTILREVNKEMKKYQAKISDFTSDRNLELFVSKNQGSFFAKSAAGICTSDDV
jgi:hypothetical protein